VGKGEPATPGKDKAYQQKKVIQPNSVDGKGKNFVHQATVARATDQEKT